MAEHTSLRDEIIQRIELRQGYVSITLAMAGVFLGAGVAFAEFHVALLFPLLAPFLAVGWVQNDLRAREVAKHIREHYEGPPCGLGWEKWAQGERDAHRGSPWRLVAVSHGGVLAFVPVAMVIGLSGPDTSQLLPVHGVLLALEVSALAAAVLILRRATRTDECPPRRCLRGRVSRRVARPLSVPGRQTGGAEMKRRAWILGLMALVLVPMVVACTSPKKATPTTSAPAVPAASSTPATAAPATTVPATTATAAGTASAPAGAATTPPPAPATAPSSQPASATAPAGTSTPPAATKPAVVVTTPAQPATATPTTATTTAPAAAPEATKPPLGETAAPATTAPTTSPAPAATPAVQATASVSPGGLNVDLDVAIPPPEGIFAQSAAALAALKSYRYVTVFSFTGEEDGKPESGSVEVRGTVAAPDQQHVTWKDLETGNEFGIRRIGGQAWILDGTEWTSVPTVVADTMSQAVLIYAPSMSWSTSAEGMKTTSQYVGTETVNGIRCRHYSSAYRGWSQYWEGEITDSTGDVWIAEAGYPVRYRFAANGIDEDGDRGSMLWTMELTDVDEPLTIEAPQPAAAPGEGSPQG